MENNIIDKRTKGEWILSTTYMNIRCGERDICQISNPTIKPVNLCLPDKQYKKAMEANELLKKETEANAAFICKAVNNYEQLLTALKDIFQYDQENTWVGRTALKAIQKAENHGKQITV